MEQIVFDILYIKLCISLISPSNFLPNISFKLYYVLLFMLPCMSMTWTYMHCMYVYACMVSFQILRLQICCSEPSTMTCQGIGYGKTQAQSWNIPIGILVNPFYHLRNAWPWSLLHGAVNGTIYCVIYRGRSSVKRKSRVNDTRIFLQWTIYTLNGFSSGLHINTNIWSVLCLSLYLIWVCNNHEMGKWIHLH